MWEAAANHSSAAVRRLELSRPSILRFATDTFMDDFLKMTENDPKRLNQYVALPETWRGIAPLPEALNPAPAFAKNFKRLGLLSARKKAKLGGAVQTTDKFTAFANSSASKPLKLYQPAHQRFYMISACLVCERPGLPDKIPNAGREEKVTYVIRRMFPKVDSQPTKPLPPPDSTYEEYAYVITDQGARWKKVSNTDSLETGEEQQSLFSVSITEDDGRRRKIFAGLIPTGRRESYIAAGKFSEKSPDDPTNPDKPIDSRVYTMRSQFRDTWKNLLQTASYAKKAAVASENGGDVNQIKAAQRDIVKTAREQIQNISWLILLDLANYLTENLPNVWAALNNSALESGLTTPELALVNVFKNTVLGEAAFGDNLKLGTNAASVSASLKQALLDVKPANAQASAAIEKGLETVINSYDRENGKTDALYPKFLFPLADPGYNADAAPKERANYLLKTVLDGATVFITPTNFLKTKLNEGVPDNLKIKDGEDYVNRIAQLIEAALPPMPPTQPQQTPPLASQTPMDMREGWFVIRCVYERPLCGTIDPPILSEPTRAFQIAGFFDPDAPARPIRIALPVDTTPAGLRKFDRNTAFMMSDMLCGQVNRMKGITFADLVFSVLPFPFHKSLNVPDTGGCKDGGLSIGMMCSLSIPIITICALILLMIIVALLDFIFKWLPFLIFCFPLPGLKAKNE